MFGELGKKQEELDWKHPMRNIDYWAIYRNKQKNQKFYTCTKNKRTRTINEIHKLRNNRKIAKKLETNINDLRQGLKVYRATVLGIGK